MEFFIGLIIGMLVTVALELFFIWLLIFRKE